MHTTNLASRPAFRGKTIAISQPVSKAMGSATPKSRSVGILAAMLVSVATACSPAQLGKFFDTTNKILQQTNTVLEEANKAKEQAEQLAGKNNQAPSATPATAKKPKPSTKEPEESSVNDFDEAARDVSGFNTNCGPIIEENADVAKAARNCKKIKKEETKLKCYESLSNDCEYGKYSEKTPEPENNNTTDAIEDINTTETPAKPFEEE